MKTYDFKPILFSTPMVQAILRGDKTQTRRIIKPQPSKQLFDVNMGYWSEEPENLKQPYFKATYRVGDIMWVRETFQPITKGFKYKADGIYTEGHPANKWKPSIFMPKEACRIFLKVTNIRVERLQDISNSDIVKEGAASFGCCTKKLNWQILWEKINGIESWKDNPWVFVYEFERTDASFANR